MIVRSRCGQQSIVVWRPAKRSRAFARSGSYNHRKHHRSNRRGHRRSNRPGRNHPGRNRLGRSRRLDRSHLDRSHLGRSRHHSLNRDRIRARSR